MTGSQTCAIVITVKQEIATPMIAEFATPEDFSKWEKHSKTLDLYSLKFIIEDCRSAAENMKGWNPIREGFYLDQAATYGMEYTKRRKLS